MMQQPQHSHGSSSTNTRNQQWRLPTDIVWLFLTFHGLTVGSMRVLPLVCKQMRSGVYETLRLRAERLHAASVEFAKSLERSERSRMLLEQQAEDEDYEGVDWASAKLLPAPPAAAARFVTAQFLHLFSELPVADDANDSLLDPAVPPSLCTVIPNALRVWSPLIRTECEAELWMRLDRHQRGGGNDTLCLFALKPGAAFTQFATVTWESRNRVRTLWAWRRKDVSGEAQRQLKDDAVETINFANLGKAFDVRRTKSRKTRNDGTPQPSATSQNMKNNNSTTATAVQDDNNNRATDSDITAYTQVSPNRDHDIDASPSKRAKLSLPNEVVNVVNAFVWHE